MNKGVSMQASFVCIRCESKGVPRSTQICLMCGTDQSIGLPKQAPASLKGHKLTDKEFEYFCDEISSGRLMQADLSLYELAQVDISRIVKEVRRRATAYRTRSLTNAMQLSICEDWKSMYVQGSKPYNEVCQILADEYGITTEAVKTVVRGSVVRGRILSAF